MKYLQEGRRNFHFHLIRTPVDALAAVIGTAGGAGLLPKAPGTCGTLVGVLITFLLFPLMPSLLGKLLFLSFLYIIGCWASVKIDLLMNTHDNQNIVMDEVVGYCVTALFCTTPREWFVAFILFRILDIWKPYPINIFDRIAIRTKSVWLNGFAVMADDAIAGILGLGLISLYQHYFN
jgi:phosphatidylglycerophosphatase A